MARKKSAAKRAREAEDAPQEPVKKVKEVKEVEKVEEESPSDPSDESSSEEEDQFGDLLTEDVEQGINKVLEAIKTGDKALFDKNVTFFKDPEEGGVEKAKEQKPMYLKDYHRKVLLDGHAFEDEDGEEREWKEGEKPYALQQQEDKSKLLSEINTAFSDDDNDDFLQKKEIQREVKAEKLLPDPQQDGEKFLEAYLENAAWIPENEEERPDLEEDDDLFDEAAEKFENAYNFRFEDPNSAEIISYARSQATMRREKMNSRKKQRIKKKEQQLAEEEEKKELLRKKKQKKTTQVLDRLAEIKAAVGEEVSEATIAKVFGDSLLKDDFDDADWDSKMAEIFNEEFYNEGEKEKLDVGEVEDDDDEEVEEVEEVEEDISTKSKRAQKKEEKVGKKKEKQKLREVADKLVTSHSDQLMEEVEEERGRGKDKDEIKFRYREVSPESFGLSTREILVADDKDLNELIGLKKFAPYRPKESRLKDKRKYAKKRRLREWRLKVFKSADGLANEPESK
ncbi:hypothetical protein OGAPHI_007120 [Ogataea philodendri]|uniref:Kri1-like C-terminal domain-containing protein n=3 Tax=Saccharomycotina TaxID=147537 RepID=A0A9P8NW51_9ASCO|nr:uncharacterized protein OGAPHI_007120 [Ogataea philodendri]KAH3660534.1 hypothetical protein OGAPHI_007120 [Ogataea philodendri]